MEDCAAFISKSSTALPKYQAVLGPFDPAVWILVAFVYLIAILPFTMNTNYTFISLITKPSRLLHMFWYVFSTFTNSFVVKNPLLDSGIAKNATSLLIGTHSGSSSTYISFFFFFNKNFVSTFFFFFVQESIGFLRLS